MKVLSLGLLLFFTLLCTVSAQNFDDLFAGLKTDREKADTLFSLALKSFNKARFDSAAYILEKGKLFAEASGDHELITKYFIQQSYIHLFREEFEEGLKLLQKAHSHLAKTASYNLEYKYFFLNGRLSEGLHRNDSALYYYRRLEALNSRKHPYQNYMVYYCIGQMFKRADAFAESEKYFEKAYELTKPRGIKKDHLTVLMGYSDLCYLMHKPDKYAVMMNEQQTIMDGINRDFSQDPVHSMFFTDWKKKRLNEKVPFMKNVKMELQKNGHNQKAALVNNYIARFYEDENLPDSALQYIRENQAFFEEKNDIHGLYSNTAISYRLLKNAGRKADALKEADRLFMLKDSIIRLQHREMVMDLETKYQTNQKEKDIALLSAENKIGAYELARATDLKEALLRENLLKDSVVSREKDYSALLAHDNELKKSQLQNEQALKDAISRESILKSSELAKEKNIKWQLIIGASLLLLSAAIIFILYRKQRSKNLLIQKQADDLQMLMREIHHRVKNNLQVISSLLDLQSLTIKDRQASQAIKESRNRVYSMALIHQNLYKEENVIGIEMNDYINKLVQSLFESYNSGGNKIALETDIDTLLLDVDMVIPIGLVLNELISNSLKYAFNNTSSGTLHIGLKKREDEMLLTVKDNGAGFPKGMNVFQTTSFGFKLVKAFAQKLKAKLEVYNDNGACILLHIKKMKFA